MQKKFALSHFNKNIDLLKNNEPNCLPSVSYLAIIRPLMASSIYNYEQIEAMHLINRKFFCFTIRYEKEANNYSYVKFEDRSFRIIRIINWNEENRFTQIYAEEENV